MKKFIPYFLAISFSLLFLCSLANAAFMTYNSQTDFLNDLTAGGYFNQQTLDFEGPGQSAGTTVLSGTTLDGVTFLYDNLADGDLGIDPDDFDMLITDLFDTTSPFNSLGTTGDDAFFAGDYFTMQIDHTIHAIGLYVNSADIILPGDFELRAGSGSVSTNGVVDQTLSDGDAYFLGLIETDPTLGFNSVVFESFFPDANYSFNIDDITTAVVPEPTTFVIAGLFLLGVGPYLRRKFKK